jgi:hypothetical protein
VTEKLSKLYRYGNIVNSHDLIKVVAIILMIIDHIGELLLNDNPWCRLIGRGAAPLFFFLVGYVNKLNITPSLITYGLILSFTTILLKTGYFVNILIVFILIQCTLELYPPTLFSTSKRIIFFALATLGNIVAYGLIEYGFLGFLIAYSARLVALKDPQADYFLLFSLIVYLLWESLVFYFLPFPKYFYPFIFIVIALFFSLRRYSLFLIFLPKWLNLPCLFISRYSLEIYFYHLILLQGIRFGWESVHKIGKLR